MGGRSTGTQGQDGPQGPKGDKGDPGAEGSASGAVDIDMQNKYEIFRLKSNPYPIHGDLTKVITIRTREISSFQRRKAGKWKQALI